MGKNILTYEEFLNDCYFIDESRISSIDFIKMLIEEEHENGYDLIDCDEGWSVGSRGRNSDRTFKFTPGKNDTDITSTEIFNEDKKFKKQLIDAVIKYSHDLTSLITAAVLIKRKFTIEEIADNYYASVDLFGGGWF